MSVDQLLITEMPALIAQMKGFLMDKRYYFCTVFINHFSGLTFGQPQQSTTAAKTIEAKRAFAWEAE